MSFFGSQWATRMEEARIAAYVKASAERTAKWRRENQDKIIAFNKKWGLGEFAKPKELAPLPAKVGDSGRCGSKIGLPPTPEQLVVGKSNLRSVQRYCPTVDELWIGSFSLKKTKRPLQPCDPELLGPLPIPIESLELDYWPSAKRDWPSEYILDDNAKQIQRVWRGFQCRRVLALRRAYEETGKLFGRFDGVCRFSNGATAIQCVWRISQSCKRMKLKKELEEFRQWNLYFEKKNSGEIVHGTTCTCVHCFRANIVLPAIQNWKNSR